MVDKLQDKTVLKIQDLELAYGSRKILNRLKLELYSGETVAIMGESGSGKTSLLNCILGSVEATGSCNLGGEEIIGASRKKLARIRSKKLGIVFQHGELLEELLPIENVAIAGLIAGEPRNQVTTAAKELLIDLGVPIAGVATGELSGGERQRTALARALLNNPPLILADEPTGSLDKATRDSVLATMIATVKRNHSAMVLVTHDAVVAGQLDRVLRLENGQLVPERD